MGRAEFFLPGEILWDTVLIQIECNACYFYICDMKMTLCCYTAAYTVARNLEQTQVAESSLYM